MDKTNVLAYGVTNGGMMQGRGGTSSLINLFVIYYIVTAVLVLVLLVLLIVLIWKKIQIMDERKRK